MTLKTSNRANKIQSFRALGMLSEVAERRAAGEDIISLAPGQPCFGVPSASIEAAQRCLQNDPIQGYTAAVGMLPLRERMSQYYGKTYGMHIDTQRFGIAASSSAAFTLALITAFDAGDTVALTTPTYPAYRNMLRAFDINVVEIPTNAQTNYQPTAALLEASGEKFDGIIITSPSNPTGTIISDEALKGVCEWCDKNEVRIISDEAYHGITYETAASTALKYSDNAIVLGTFSKYFAMTGWRLGWLVVPADMVDAVKNTAENLFVSPPTIAQHVALDVLDRTDELDQYVAHYRKNRDILSTELPKIGLGDMAAAQGAFYLYINVRDLTNNSEEFCRKILDNAKVALTPGMDFDTDRGNTTVRISYAGTPEDMYEACERIKKVVG